MSPIPSSYPPGVTGSEAEITGEPNLEGHPTDSDLIGWCPGCQMPYSAPSCSVEHALMAEVKARPGRLLQVLSGQGQLLAKMAALLEAARPPAYSASPGVAAYVRDRAAWTTDRAEALATWYESQEAPEEATPDE
jgi:hypothetical protein